MFAEGTKPLSSSLTTMVASLSILFVFACSDDNKKSTEATGGSASTGGTAKTGGTLASGGTTTSGGATASGGSTSSGGASAAGGASTSGGSTSSGGSTAAGGALAAGGSTSSGGTIALGGSTSSGGVTASGGATSSGGSTSAGGPDSGISAKPFVEWLKEYISSQYSGVQVAEHHEASGATWYQAKIETAPKVVISWALISETSLTLSKVEGVRDGKSLFIDKTSKEAWADVTGVKYYEGVGYYITGYASSMGTWDVGKLTVVQFDGDSKDFAEKMAQARMKAK